MMPKKNIAIVLLSGGVDSATCLAIAKFDGFDCFALSFDYGQRSRSELNAAKKLAESYEVLEHKVIHLDIGQLGGSALTDLSIEIPQEETAGIPPPYVPARNTVFISYALAWAEVKKASAIYIGVNAVDYSGYPDCRPEYIKAVQDVVNLATKAGIEGKKIKLETPLINHTKAQIIEKGTQLGVNFADTVSCYQAGFDGSACGKCDSCRLRRNGFLDAGLEDVTTYK